MTAVAERVVVTEAGVYDGMPDEVYHGDPVPGGSLSASGAKLLLPPNPPALYRWRRENPEQRRVFDLGKAAHKLVLGTGPELSIQDYPDWRTKAAREARDAAYAAGAVPILRAEYDDAVRMADAIRRHPVASRLFEPGGGQAEQSLFWEDAATGVWRRARLDWLPTQLSSAGRLIVPDYKTTDSADDESVRKAIHRYGYYLQDPWYREAVQAVGLADEALFLFVFQERKPPHLIHVVELEAPALRTGRDHIRRALATYAECTATGRWPGYSDDEIGLVDLPPWAQTKENHW